MDAELQRQAEAARGFMPADEGLALHEAAERVAAALPLANETWQTWQGAGMAAVPVRDLLALRAALRKMDVTIT